MEMNNKFACYLAPMNKSEETDSKDVANALEQPNESTTDDDDEDTDDEHRQFVVNTSPIKDKSFLSPRMQEFCRDLKTYWLTQKDDNTVDGANTRGTAGVHRQKRGCYRYRCRRVRRICICIRCLFCKRCRRVCIRRVVWVWCHRCRY
ncbi:uncharacterized protein LOC106151784 [Lingula anatina]|uniref:Uncharacterized protein LOC106151784 n=1 Tax=Lingula anatina TaxID=7574 RepID=A0A1S3H3W2_LINAN|nr:uncharacterized protein LOC106151784 [Lingula anatina]|eukprot:XP_013380647.1 uncharacterized protein LOC106151784 [Lingula anatina]